MAQHLVLQTQRGASVQCFHWASSAPCGIVITAAGAGGGPGPGGSDGPYYLYKRLAEELPNKHNVSVLQIVYHLFSDMQAAVDDILAAVDWVHGTIGSRIPIVLIGWSMGGAAVVETAYLRGRTVKGIITIGGQTVGGENGNKLNSETSFAILHGAADTCISPAAAQFYYQLAGGQQKKNLICKIFPEEDHGIKGSWEFLTRGTNAYLRHLFDISEMSWVSSERSLAASGKSHKKETSCSEFYILANGKLITVPCKDFSKLTIGNIKSWFSSNYQVAIANQEYIFNGVTLNDHNTLQETGIQPKSTIRLQFKN